MTYLLVSEIEKMQMVELKPFDDIFRNYLNTQIIRLLIALLTRSTQKIATVLGNKNNFD